MTAPTSMRPTDRERSEQVRRPFLAAIAVLAATLSACGSNPARISANHEGVSTESSFETTTNDAWAAMVAFFAGGAVLEVEGFDSLDAMARSSDLVVLARVESIGTATSAFAPDAGPSDAPPPPTTTFRLEILDGSPSLLPGDKLEVQAFGVSIEHEVLGPTTDAALLFLRRRADTGALRLVSSTGLLVDRGGVARLGVPLENVGQARALALGHGRQFSEVVGAASTAAN